MFINIEIRRNETVDILPLILLCTNLLYPFHWSRRDEGQSTLIVILVASKD